MRFSLGFSRFSIVVVMLFNLVARRALISNYADKRLAASTGLELINGRISSACFCFYIFVIDAQLIKIMNEEAAGSSAGSVGHALYNIIYSSCLLDMDGWTKPIDET
jgi:hypothetical protein